MSMNVANCPRCGKLFVKGMYDICPNCVKDNELQYEKCVKYLRDHKQANLQELSEATEVSVNQITKFIREGRISIVTNPNMSYSCEVCGTSIREGALCDGCRQKLIRDTNRMLEDEKRKNAQQPTDSRMSYNIKDRLQGRR